MEMWQMRTSTATGACMWIAMCDLISRCEMDLIPHRHSVCEHEHWQMSMSPRPQRLNYYDGRVPHRVA